MLDESDEDLTSRNELMNYGEIQTPTSLGIKYIVWKK